MDAFIVANTFYSSPHWDVSEKCITFAFKSKGQGAKDENPFQDTDIRCNVICVGENRQFRPVLFFE